MPVNEQITPDSPAARLQKRIKVGIRIGLGVLAFWCFIQFGCYTMKGNAMSGVFSPGTRLFYDRLFDSHNGCMPGCDTSDSNLKRYSTIIFEHSVDNHNWTLVSTVIGVPGDQVVFTGKSGIVLVGPRKLKFKLRGSVKTTLDKIIPPRKYFVVNNNESADSPDSRDFGYLDANNIVGKVVWGF